MKAVTELEPTWGRFVLFALFLREDSPDKWDLLVSSPALENARLTELSEFTHSLTRIVGLEEFEKLSRIVTLNKDDPGLWAILRSLGVKRGVVEIRDSNYSGVQIVHGFVFRADKKAAELEEHQDS